MRLIFALKWAVKLCVHTITSGQWMAPEVVLLTNQWFLMAEPVSCVTPERHRGTDRQVMA